MMEPRPRLLTVVRDLFPPLPACGDEEPDRSELEELLGRSIDLVRARAAQLHPAGGPSNVVPLRPRRRS